jgi:hypothetical protein
MSKGNSELLSKHQAKLSYSGVGVIGDVKGYEVLTEVVVRVSNGVVNNSHEIKVSGRMATDSAWYVLGFVTGAGTDIFHVASWDYILFECVIYDCADTCSLLSSGYFNDGMFAVNAINNMKEELSQRLLDIDDSICGIREEIKVINRQIELITDHEEDEVK